MDFQIPDLFFPIVALTIAGAIALYSWNRSRVVALVSIGWAILSLFTSQIPQNMNDPIMSYLAFNTIFGLPIILLLIASYRSKTFMTFLAGTPVWVLTATQIYRLSGGSLLILYLSAQLPAEIGLSNGVQDIVIGLTALPLAWLLYHGFQWSRNLAIVWNFLGLVDFISAAVIISLVTFGAIHLSPEPTQMGMYPLALISVYQVPIAFFLHIHLLIRLLRTDEESRSTRTLQ